MQLLDNKTLKTVDKLAPEKKVKKMIKNKMSWYNQNLVELKISLRNKKKVWLKYIDHHWIAFKHRQSQNQSVIRWAKINFFKSNIERYTGNSGELYKAVKYLSGMDKMNLMHSSAYI